MSISSAPLARAAADDLTREGLLEFEEDIYSLSAAGREAFLRLAGEACLPLKPGVTSDRVRTALRGELMLLLDKRHLQRWGVKEYVSPFRFALPQKIEVGAVHNEDGGFHAGGQFKFG